MSNTTVLCLYPRGLCNSMHHMVTTIEQTPAGLYVVGCEVLVDELTPEQRAEYERDRAEGEAMAEAYAEQEPKFRTIEHAAAYAEAVDAVSDTDYDLRAFGAPSECWADAMPAREAAVEAALANAVYERAKGA